MNLRDDHQPGWDDEAHEYWLSTGFFDSCPECGSTEKLYSIGFGGNMKCKNCGLVIDDDWYKANEPEIILTDEGKRINEN